MNAPQWRIWLVTALVCGWGILAIAAFQKGKWEIALMYLLLLIGNSITLWRLTKYGK